MNVNLPSVSMLLALHLMTADYTSCFLGEEVWRWALKRENHVIHMKEYSFLSYINLVDLTLNIALVAVLLVIHSIEVVVRGGSHSVV